MLIFYFPEMVVVCSDSVYATLSKIRLFVFDGLGLFADGVRWASCYLACDVGINCLSLC